MTTVFEPHWILLDDEMIADLKPGDVLRRHKSSIWHLGVYLGDDKVLHNSPGLGVGERVTTFKVFACGREVYVAHSNPETRAEVMERASGIVAHPHAYSYVWRNCEHTVYEVIEGKPRSPTVRLMDFVVGSALMLVLAGVGFSYRRELGSGADKLLHRD
jgi:hypothetical protein